MNIKTPIATWILTSLFDGGLPVSEKTLARNLCQASFASMAGDEDFEEIVKELEKSGYIEFTSKETTTHIQVPIPVAPSMIPLFDKTKPDYKIQEVKVDHSGYVITVSGIMAVRRQIITPIEKIKQNIENYPENKVGKFKTIIDHLKSNATVTLSTIKLCIDNAPLFLDFINYVKEMKLS